ncbi:MAG: glycosyltransferase family 4 protein [Symploca sp. SIO2E6]|nr:glycosyltransferase family 4 protein [Symploca sp. SIO2E6]
MKTDLTIDAGTRGSGDAGTPESLSFVVNESSWESDLRAELGINNLLLMYVGNLETYQGIDLLLESFALTLQQHNQLDLVIIGGETSDIHKYQNLARHLGIWDNVHFLGAKPVEHLAMYLSQADMLVSPRTQGKNTPMKLYSYLDSGKALLATDLPTHTQVVDSQVAMLAEPNAEAFSEGMLRLAADQNLRLRLGCAGKHLIEQKHTYTAFSKKLTGLYDWLESELVENTSSGVRGFRSLEVSGV